MERLSPGTVVIISSDAMQYDEMQYPGWNENMLDLCDKPVTIRQHTSTEGDYECYYLEEDCAYWIWSDRWMTVPTDKVTKTDINQLLCSKESDSIAT